MANKTKVHKGEEPDENEIRLEDHLPPIQWNEPRFQQALINRQHTLDEMTLALQRFERIKGELHLLPDDDDPCQVFANVIAEVVEKRSALASVSGFFQRWLSDQSRR